MSKAKQLGSALESRVVRRAQAAGLEAAVQPGSGVFKDFPHDAVIEQRLVECKVRTAELDAKGNSSVRVQFDWLLRTIKDAAQAGFRGAVLVVNAKGSREPLVLLSLTEYLDLVKRSKSAPEAER